MSKGYIEILNDIAAYSRSVERVVSEPVPLWSAIWVLFTDDYYETTHDVVCLWQGKEWGKFSKAFVDIVAVHYDRNGLDDLILFLGSSPEKDILDIGEADGCFKQLRKHTAPGRPKKDNGQLKLCSNYFYLVEKPNATVIIIGSGGPYGSLSGLTYQNVAYRAKRVICMDPHEVSQIVGNITYVGEEFNYDSLPDPSIDYVIDDSYVDAVVEDNRPVKKVIDSLPQYYNGKFSVIDVGTHYILEASRDRHIPGSSGGGTICKMINEVYTYGTSGTTGSYPYNSLIKSFPWWNIAPPVAMIDIDRASKLRKCFPNADISHKRLTEDMFGGFAVAQPFYVGHETRVYNLARLSHLSDVKNLTPEQHKERDAAIAAYKRRFALTSCGICAIVRAMGGKAYTEEEIRAAYVAVGGVSCGTCHSKKKRYAMSIVKNCAIKLTPYHMTIDELMKNLKWTQDSAESFVQYAISIGVVVHLGQRLTVPSRRIRHPQLDYDDPFLVNLIAIILNRGIVGELTKSGMDPIYYGSGESTSDVVVASPRMSFETLNGYHRSHTTRTINGMLILLKMGFQPPEYFFDAIKMSLTYPSDKMDVYEGMVMYFDKPSGIVDYRNKLTYQFILPGFVEDKQLVERMREVRVLQDQQGKAKHHPKKKRASRPV